MTQNNALAIFEKIKADIAKFIAPALDHRVKDQTEADQGLFLAKQVKNFEKLVEERRKEIVGPLNDEVKKINAYAKSIIEPLSKAETHLKRELLSWDKVLEEERTKKRLEAEELFRQQQAALAAAEEKLKVDDLFGNDPKMFLKEASLDQAKIEVKQELVENLKEADSIKVSGVQKFWTFEVVDESLIPREYFELKPSLIRAAITAGKREIAGIRIFQESRMSIRQ